MKIRYMKAAVATALCAAAGSAMAFDARTIAPAYTVAFSGATASSNSVRTWVIDKICDPVASIDVYRSTNADWAVACQTRTHQDIDGDTVVDAGETVAAKNVLFRKRDVGGSGVGVTPVTHPTTDAVGGANPTTATPLNPGGVATGFEVAVASVTLANCTNAGVAASTANGTNFLNYTGCGTATDLVVPDAGFSDIEPNKFFGVNTPSGLPPYSASTGVSINTFGALVFGTPVSLDLRNALQAVQFPSTSVCHPANAGYAANAESEACMPNLTSTEIRSLFTGGIPSWNNFLVTNPVSPTGAKIAMRLHPDVVALGTAPADQKVQICTRTNGSGTKAQFRAHFLNWPCSSDASQEAVSNVIAGPIVNNGGSSTVVGQCLDDFNDGSNVSTFNGAATKRWAIGINSTENNPTNALSYRFTKIDGAAPTIQAVHAGDYSDYAEQSFQYRTTADRLLNATLAADKTDTLAILAYMAAQGNTPNDTASINTSYVFTWGQGGWLVTPRTTGGFNPTNPFTITNPVNSSTRAPFGKAPNACHPPTTIKTVQGGI